jgi:hypothetical protein
VDKKPIVRLGLVPSPVHCHRIADDIAETLADVLIDQIDDTVTWEVVVEPDPLTGSNVEVPELLDEIYSWVQSKEWDYGICLTDLPLRRAGRIVVAEASDERDIGFISVPSLGALAVRSRTRAMILQLMEGLYHGTSPDDVSRQKVGKDEAVAVDAGDSTTDVDIRYGAPRTRGHLRLVAGMVYANQPWTLFPNFKTTVATAFATGAYGLIFTTLWELGDAYGIGRLTTLMFAAMFLLIGWIIISHDLWEPHRKASSQYLTTLYNATTILTITTGVVFAYAAIFLLLLTAAIVYIPASMLESTLEHPISALNYLTIAWVAASVATIAGAIGAGLEDTEAVQNATFGWRQQHRFQEHKHFEDSE